MGLFGWIYYLIIGILIYFGIIYIENKYTITKLEKLIITIIMWMVIAGITYEWGFPYTSDFFLVFVFVLVLDSIYSGYFLDRDFFDKNEGNLLYYVLLIIIGFIINQAFINQVNKVFLTGEDLRLVLWFLIIIFLYKFCQDKKIFQDIINPKKMNISKENVLVQYAKLKYRYNDICNYKDKTISDIIYSIMIFQNMKRSKVLRNIDYFMFRIKGDKRKLGIMQVESKKFITDIESIEIVHKKIEKIYNDKKPSRGKVKVEEIINTYDKNNCKEYMFIFDIISKF